MWLWLLLVESLCPFKFTHLPKAPLFIWYFCPLLNHLVYRWATLVVLIRSVSLLLGRSYLVDILERFAEFATCVEVFCRHDARTGCTLPVGDLFASHCCWEMNTTTSPRGHHLRNHAAKIKISFTHETILIKPWSNQASYLKQQTWS